MDWVGNMKNYFDDNHANNRLSRCFVFVKTEDGKWKCKQIDRASKNLVSFTDGSTIKLHSDKLLIVPDGLGYINLKHQCVYLTRSTRRMWKAGITRDNLIIDRLYHNYPTGGMAHIDVLLEKVLNNSTLKPFKEAYHQVKNGVTAARAFSPIFCVGLSEKSKSICLYYKNREVGVFDKDCNLFVGDVNSFLKEQIEDATGLEVII